MAERKTKRETENLNEIETEEHGFILEPSQVELGAGYTLNIKYDENENPIVNVKTYGKVDLTQLRREIEKAFPNARIQQLNPPQPVIVTKKRRKQNIKKKQK